MADLTVAEWIKANWPATVNPNACRHCGGEPGQGETLIPLGYGARVTKVWVHWRCADAWRDSIHLAACRAITKDLFDDEPLGLRTGGDSLLESSPVQAEPTRV